MPRIEIEDDIYEYLQGQAIAFVETEPSDVLRRLLGLTQRSGPHTSKTNESATAVAKSSDSYTRDQLTSQERYQQVIVEALREMNGRARTKDVLRRLEEMLKDEHTEADLAKYSSGGVRWRARASSEALVLRNKGILNKDAAHGWWELTEKGENLTDE